MKMKSVTARGDRLKQLKELARVLAESIDSCLDPKALPPLARQYRETIREIEEIEGANNHGDEKSATSLASAPLMGSQEPSERIAPEYQRSDGFDAAKLVRVGGTVLDPGKVTYWTTGWVYPGGQVGRAHGGRQRTAPERQKPADPGPSEAGMLMYNEQVIYTAPSAEKTATETLRKCETFSRGRNCGAMWPRSRRPSGASRSS